jgi:HAD superfamily hydrolase (TIGR01509 family)
VSPPFDLVIFDCDGVLVDSESIANEVLVGLLADWGISVAPEDAFHRFVGRSLPQCRDIIAGLLGRPAPESFEADYGAGITAAMESRLKCVEGIESCLDALGAAGVPYCVASNGTHDRMRMTLGLTGLSTRFEGKRFSVEDVVRGKPAPDVFLHAASRHGIQPSACCVVEDTPTGVTAGVAAGMTVFGYCALTPQRLLVDAGAHHTFTRMRQLPDLVLAGG